MKKTKKKKKPVYKRVQSDMMKRVKLGKDRYGVYLSTHNGRDAIQDSLEEAWDLVFYLTQLQMELEDEKKKRK